MHVTHCSRSFLQPITRLASAAALVLLTGTLAMAQKEATIHNFVGGTDGAYPMASLLADSAGNLYGTTLEGGSSPSCMAGSLGCGTVFELTPPGSGADHWTETILYTFQGQADGESPAAPLVFDDAGNLYGTTLGAGQNNDGVIFELSPPTQTNGAWNETVLYNFTAEVHPSGGLVIDSEGNLFGVASAPEVYELSPPSAPGGTWTFAVLHVFDTQDGGLNPEGLTLDRAGNIYGISEIGGNGTGPCHRENTCGLVFELVRNPMAGDPWKEKVLYNFTGKDGDGATPTSGVVFHGGNNLYGTAADGGDANGDGTVFELSYSGGSWAETTLYEFNSATSGYRPEAGVAFDHEGNLYGTTYFGLDGEGGVYELSPPAEPGSSWTFTSLFDAGCGASCATSTGVVLGKGNALYGTMMQGGVEGLGSVYGVIP
jgi:uncharacterized repeat protein (TIGR03803 family)